MKYQPNSNIKTDDVVMTPDAWACQIVEHFTSEVDRLTRVFLDPCEGTGAFTRAFEQCGVFAYAAYEITQGLDFMTYDGDADFIITNPPWSQIRQFMEKSFTFANDVVFLHTINHAFTTCRYNMAQRASFGLKEILLLDWPDNFPKSGFLLGAVHWQRGYDGPVEVTDGRSEPCAAKFKRAMNAVN